MPVIHNESSPYVQELKQWDTPKRLGGHAPDGYEPYPRMLYRAAKNENDRWMCGDPVGESSPDVSRAARAQAFTRSCQMIVRSAGEELRAREQGWRESPDEAMQVVRQREQDISTAAAEEHFRVQRMGELARREYDAADRATDAHVPTLDAPPRRPRGRPRKTPIVPPPTE